MLQIWGQANSYARLMIIMYFALPMLLIFLTCVAETEGTNNGHEKS